MTTVAPDAPKVLPRVKSPMKKRIKVFEKATIKESCYTCGTKITLESFEEGHDIANILGGTQELSNLYPLCKPCNREMGILTISQYIEKREREKVL
jgi:5-methylcytosine-specific restriction endonuclease McrA